MADQQTQTVSQTDMAATQDSLRPVRMFIGALTGALAGSDQSPAWQDGVAYAPPYRYQNVGPYGYSVEGTPIAAVTPVAATQNGGLYISPMMVLLGLGAAAALLWKH